MAKKDVRPVFREAALSLFMERGYEATTTADVAERAGMTERTLFRYFADKRELVFDDEASGYDMLLAEIEAAPSSMDALGAMFHAFASLESRLVACRAVMEPRRQVVAASPALQEREASKLVALTADVAERLRRRGVRPLEASLAARIGMAALADTLRSWFDDPSCGYAERLARSRASLLSLVADS